MRSPIKNSAKIIITIIIIIIINASQLLHCLRSLCEAFWALLNFTNDLALRRQRMDILQSNGQRIRNLTTVITNHAGIWLKGQRKTMKIPKTTQPIPSRMHTAASSRKTGPPIARKVLHLRTRAHLCPTAHTLKNRTVQVGLILSPGCSASRDVTPSRWLAVYHAGLWERKEGREAFGTWNSVLEHSQVNSEESESSGTVLRTLELVGKKLRIAVFSRIVCSTTKVHRRDAEGVPKLTGPPRPHANGLGPIPGLPWRRAPGESRG
jgi:hypothetical protein